MKQTLGQLVPDANPSKATERGIYEMVVVTLIKQWCDNNGVTQIQEYYDIHEPLGFFLYMCSPNLHN